MHTLTIQDSVDPSCTIGIKGTAFAASIHDVTLPDGTIPSFLDVQRSSGRTWRPSAVRVNTRSVDRAYVTADVSHGPFRGHVYVHGYLQRPRDSSGKPLAAAFVLYPCRDGAGALTVHSSNKQPGSTHRGFFQRTVSFREMARLPRSSSNWTIPSATCPTEPMLSRRRRVSTEPCML